MTAPTTRETADHAELALLAEDALIPMPEKRRRSWFNRQNRFRYAFTPAVCSSLLSEIAALRGERDEAVELLKQFHTRIMLERRCNSLGVNVAELIMEKTRAFLANQGADQ